MALKGPVGRDQALNRLIHLKSLIHVLLKLILICKTSIDSRDSHSF